MHVSRIHDAEKKVLDTGLSGLRMESFVFPVNGDQGVVLTGHVCHRNDNRATYYYPEETAKERIVLHFTAGNLRGDLITLTGDIHVSVPYVIARDGTVYQLFSPKHWSYHLGRGSVGGNTKQSKATIGIEISNYGPLEKQGDKLETIYTKPGRPDVYTEVTDKTAFTQVQSPFRGYSYFASYTDAQYESLILLLRHLTAEFDIPREFLPEEERYGVLDRVVDFGGIVSHVNYRPSGKWDIGPAFDWNRVINGVKADRYAPTSDIDRRIEQTENELLSAREQLQQLETRIMELEDRLEQLRIDKSTDTRGAIPTAKYYSTDQADDVYSNDEEVQADYGPDGPETGYDPTELESWDDAK